MRIRTMLAIAAIALALPVAACNSTQDQRAATGAVIGGGTGAVLGQAIGGNTAATVTGAAGGAIAGAVIGSATTPPGQSANCTYRRSDGTTFVAPCPR